MDCCFSCVKINLVFPNIVRLGPHSFPHLPCSGVIRNRRNSPPLVPAQCLSCNVLPLFVSSCVHSVTSSLMCLGPSPLSPRGPSPFFFFVFLLRVTAEIRGRLSSDRRGRLPSDRRGRLSRPEGSAVQRPERSAVQRPERSAVQRPERSAVQRPEGSAVQRPDPVVASPARQDPVVASPRDRNPVLVKIIAILFSR